MPRKRDYKAEYARRKARGRARGLSLSQIRGHPKAGETYASGKPSTPARTDELEAAVKLIRRGGSLKHAAKETGTSQERLSRYLKGNRLAEYSGGKWVMSDKRPRDVPFLKGSRQIKLTVPDFDNASLVGSYFNHVKWFLYTADPAHLAPVKGLGIRDIQGRFHSFETDPNTLFMWAAKDDPPFHEIYQIVSN